MRTITLELLRHGPAHNQLLSPLSRYLGLCGNHPAVSVNLPYEHSQFLSQLRSLEYRDSDKTGALQLRNTAATLSEMLSGIPGVIAELSNCVGDNDELTHLRLVLSATELALLPFELADAPSGLPGAGQSLLLQSQVPLCMTREVRRVSNESVDWPQKPRILFAAAAPPGVGSIPVEAHLLALRQAVEPWVFHFNENEKGDRETKVGEYLTFLPRASVEEISKHCSTGDYTHIHLLAHGQEFEQGEDRRYGLARHGRDPSGSPDVVDGERLAKVLRPHTRSGNHGLTRPAVVTIASCRGGNVGSVVGTGASIAHALHEEGVPLVIASQFPLSFAGSVIMTQVLYQGLLWGDDPRLLLNDLRRRLRSEVPNAHDWASVVAYAAFPASFDRQLAHVRVKQAHRSIEAALNHADRAIREMSDLSRGDLSDGESATASSSVSWSNDMADPMATLQGPLDRLTTAEKRLRRQLDGTTDTTAWMHGLLASTEKRLAETKWRATVWFSEMKDLSSTYQRESRVALKRAGDSYHRAFESDWSQSWAMVQELSIKAILEGGDRIPEDTWHLARLLSEHDLDGGDQQRQAWAHSNVIELLMLTRLMTNGNRLVRILDAWSSDAQPVQEISLQQIKAIALVHARGLLKSGGAASAEVHSTRRQMLRYIEFFDQVYRVYGKGFETRFDDLVEIAKAVYAELPASVVFG